MLLDLKGLIDEIDDEEVFTLANEARPGSNYLFNEVLPEVQRRGYHAKAGSMTIRPTMAKLVGMDSKYPGAAVSERSAFEHLLAKMAVELAFPEEYLRELRELVQEMFARDEDTHEVMLETVFNFIDKLLIQPHLDTAEWMRGQALVTGAIDWTSDDIRLQVDYGIPDDNFLPARTGSNGYGGNASKFWDDVRLIQQKLNYRVRAIYMHSDTLRVIIQNPANSLRIIQADELRGVYQFQRWVLLNGINVVSEDARDNVRIITYDDEGEVLDEGDIRSGKTKKIPFMPIGAVLAIGDFNAKRFVVGSGGTPTPTPVQLGYTHLGPTEEGNGRLGRWAYTYVPEGKRWQFVGQSVTNCLPVIEAPDRIVVATTEV